MTSEDDDLDEHRDTGDGPEEPEVGSMSPEARAAALAVSGLGEGGAADDDDEAHDDDEDEGGAEAAAGAAGEEDTEGEEGEAEGEDDEPGAEPGAEARLDEATGRRRRRRRRRRRGGENGAPDAFASPGGEASPAGEGAAMASGDAPAGEASASAEGVQEAAPAGGEAQPGFDAAAQSGRRIMSPVDAAIEILKGQAPGRGVHVRQIADAAVRRRLVHGEPNEAWRVMRSALATEPRERLRQGVRPRVRAAGSGLFALARRPPDMDLERAEYVFGEARRALRERTVAALEQRLAELAPSAFEAVARVLLQREGFGPATFVKRVEGTVYLEALRGRGSRPSRCLIALRPGTTAAGRRALGELRAGIRARNQDEGLLVLAGRLAEEGLSEWRQPGAPIEVVDGPTMAESCVRHGVGVINAVVSVDFVDADFFAEIAEG